MVYNQLFVVALSLSGQLLAPAADPSAELVRAIKAGDDAAIKRLLLPEITKRHPPRVVGVVTPLMEAAVRGDTTTVIRLLAAGHNLEVSDSNSGSTALTIAAALGRVEVVDTLLAAGAKIDPGGHYSPLMMAARNGHVEVVKLLVENSANVNQRRQGDSGLNALMLAASGGHLEIIKFLTDHGADIDANDYGATALTKASVTGHADCVRFLIHKKADLTIADSIGMTALHWSVICGHSKVETILKEAGAKADAGVLEKLRRERIEREKAREKEQKKPAIPRTDAEEKKEEPPAPIAPKKVATVSSKIRFKLA